MKFLVAICALVLCLDSCTSNNEKFHRNRVKFPSVESQPRVDDKRTTAGDSKVRRSSFFPPQSTSSGSNFFRESVYRNEGASDNTLDDTMDPSFASYFHPKSRKFQSETHGGSPYTMTREVLTKQGRLTGVVREMHVQSRLRNVDQFLGIPYAAPPVDSGRFMPPQTPLSWTDVRRANKMEPVCPQKLPDLSDASGYNKGRYDQIKRLLPYLQRESEDCLYLNLYVTTYGKPRNAI